MKKTLQTLLFASIAMLMPIGLSAHNFEVGGIYYNITSAEDKTVAVTFSGDSYNAVDDEYTGEVTIPATVTHGGVTYRVASIGSDAFMYCSYLTSVTIPEGVTSIGSRAFDRCEGLTSITIPEDVTSIGLWAFDQCSSLAEVHIASVESWMMISFGNMSANPCCYSSETLYINGEKLTEVEVPSSVTSIGKYVFYGYKGLASVTFSEDSQLTSIEEYAFSTCSGLTSITLPEGVTSIGECAFSGCSGLTSITLPEGVTSIGEYAFRSCTSLTSVTIPESVTFIDNGAFISCYFVPENFKNLSKLTDESNWGATLMFDEEVDGLLITDNEVVRCRPSVTNVTLPEGVTSIGKEAFEGCKGLTSVTLAKSVTSIGEDAFRDCSSLTSVTFPENAQLTSIGDYAFYGCKGLTSITIPSSVTSIGYNAFDGCTGLTSVIFPENSQLTTISYGMFYRCTGLTSITIPESVTRIESSAFADCTGLTSITIPESVTEIDDDSFEGCFLLAQNFVNNSDLTDENNWGATVVDGEENDGLVISGNTLVRCRPSVTSAIIPEGVTIIGDNAFYVCTSLTSVTIPEGVTIIGNNAFYVCTSLTSITIPEGVTSIGDYTFYKCTSLTSITLPEGVTSIGKSAFEGCKGLTSITIPEGVTSIGNSAFSGCKGLTSITIPEGVTSIGNFAFDGCKGLTSITIPEGVTSIGNYAFRSCTGLTSITIPEGVTSIGNSAFEGCKGLTSITIPEGVTSIGNSAFEGCKGLTSITIPESVTSIGDGAFASCSSLTSITIPDGVTSIGSSAFSGCTGLTSITIPEGVTSIGGFAFSGCTGLTSITIPESVTSIGNYAFYGCSSLTSIAIPKGVTVIGNDAFSGCTGLTSITLPEGVTIIGNRAFNGCSSLKDVYYLGSAEQWKAIDKGSDNDPLNKATKHFYVNGFNTEDATYWPAPLNAEGYYEIANGGQLFWFAQQVNEGGEEGRYLKAVLKNDIDLEDRPWTPIGTSGGTSSQSFRGVFDGNGNTIRGLYVNAQRNGLGLFGEVRKGVVKDFTIYGDVFLNGKHDYIGGVIGSACGIEGDNGSTISGITSYVNVTLGEGSHGSNRVAGLIGYINHNTTVERCTWLGTLDLDIYRAQDGVGGLIGKANAQCVGTIRNCAAYGTIRTAYKSGSYVNPSDSQPFTNIFIGGIVSNSLAGATTNIENCIWAGNIVDETDLGENAHIAAIGTLNGVGNVANCYYYLGSVPEVTTHNAYDTNGKVFGVYHSQLVSGEIAAKLGEAWGQNIDGEGAKDAKPVVGGAKLYYGYLSCDENAPMAYTNNAVKPEHNHVDGFCTVCGHIDTEGGIVIRDGQHTAFAIADDIAVASITYTRTLPNQEWNSLYVPFEIEVTDELLQDYEVAYANNMHAYDTDEDGSIDELEMEVIKIKQGTLHANHPYFIRAKSEADQALTLTVENAVLKATKSVSMTCQSFYTQFTLTGIYSAMDEDDFAAIEGTHYAIALEGGWWKTEGLNPFRVYMTITQRDGSPVKVSQEALSRIRIAARGDGSTDIEDVQLTDDNSPLVYDLQGRRVMEPQKGGVYVVNGKKMVW